MDSSARLREFLETIADPKEFLSDYGTAEIPAFHRTIRLFFEWTGRKHRVDYEPPNQPPVSLAGIPRRAPSGFR